ncbi:MAG TPA: tRNA pseudouridine(38-40) synthase TruA [Gemmatimonadaceae bacterium]|nr:tRNA pseudouridine(38-40) synthase TruA [Gemmatimonadaceae bacterium]
MAERTLQLVLHYDGREFAGWQIQPARRTVQGVLESTLGGFTGAPVRVMGAGRTDAGVHARGQVAGITVGERWTAEKMRRVLNEKLPDDLWVAAAREMQPAFHARYSATARRYSYAVGLDDEANSPFRRRWALPWPADKKPLDLELLDWCAARAEGTHRFRGFAVRGTAPEHDDHSCDVHSARWRSTAAGPEGLVFEIAANRFLHHMVRFLVGTMFDVATGKRPKEDFTALLDAESNDKVSPPAPPVGLCLEEVTYPAGLYLSPQG